MMRSDKVVYGAHRAYIDQARDSNLRLSTAETVRRSDPALDASPSDAAWQAAHGPQWTENRGLMRLRRPGVCVICGQSRKRLSLLASLGLRQVPETQRWP